MLFRSLKFSTCRGMADLLRAYGAKEAEDCRAEAKDDAQPAHVENAMLVTSPASAPNVVAGIGNTHSHGAFDADLDVFEQAAMELRSLGLAETVIVNAQQHVRSQLATLGHEQLVVKLMKNYA